MNEPPVTQTTHANAATARHTLSFDTSESACRYVQALEEVQDLLLAAYPIQDLDYTKMLLNVGQSLAVIRKALKGEQEVSNGPAKGSL